jgi:hypothetical protein
VARIDDTRAGEQLRDHNRNGAWRKKRADAGARACEIQVRFRSQGRSFSDSAELVREDRDAG